MKATNSIGVVIVILLLAISCNRKDAIYAEEDPPLPGYENELPPLTSTGQNTIGFMLNDKVFTPKGSYNERNNFRFKANPSTGNFRIEILRVEDSVLYEFRLVSDKLKAAGTYPISKETSERIYFSQYRILPDGSTQFICLTQNFISLFYNATGFVKLTRYDPVNRIYSGEFEASFSNPSCGMGEPIKITQGRFDVKDGN